MNPERVLGEFLDRGGQVWADGERLNVRSPKGAISDSLRAGLKQYKAELLALVGSGRRFGPISSQEQRLWYLHTHENVGNAYNMVVGFRVEGSLDRAALTEAFRLIVARHEPLRTAYVTLDGKPYRSVLDRMEIEPEWLDLSGGVPEEAERQAADYGDQFSRREFDLSGGGLLRVLLVRVAPEWHYLYIVIHHIAADGASIQIFTRELAQAYGAFSQGITPVLPELPRSYSDHVVYHQTMLAQTVADQLDYWEKELSGDLPAAELPMERTSGGCAGQRGGLVTYHWPESFHVYLKTWARQHETTVFSVLLAGFAALLRRYAHHDDILVGIASALRKQAHSEHLIGFFANTLPIRVDFSDDPDFVALVARVHEKVRAAQARDDTPFEQILGVTRLRRQAGLTPLVHALFSMHKVDQLEFEAPGGVLFQRIRMDRDRPKTPLAAVMALRGDQLRQALEYDAEFFDETTVTKMGNHFRRILEEGLRDPDRPVSEIPLLSDEECDQIVSVWNSMQAAFPMDRPIHWYVESQAARRPDAAALVWEGGSLSYGELNDRANRLAGELSQCGIGASRLAAIGLPRSAEMVVAQLAVMKTGGAYIALDPAQPNGRLADMMQDASCTVLLARPEDRAKYTLMGFDVIAVSCESEETGLEKPANISAATGPGDRVYVVFTSGSTGRPKGVVVEQGGLLNLCFWFMQRFAITAEDRMSCLFSPSFDALASEIWPCLMVGAELHFPEDSVRLSGERLRDWFLDRHITIASAPTVLAERLLRLDWPEQASLRFLVTGGDRLCGRPAPGLPFRLVNVYGPTENTVISTSYEVPTDDSHGGPPYIGRPIANTSAYILDAHGRPVPVGVTGEIFLGGVQVAREYLNQPDQTQQRFSENPFGPGRMYRTGDLGRYHPGGEIEFVGRGDTQVQLRGYRIELGEVERALQRCPDISDAAVVMAPDGHGEPRLVAYLMCGAQVNGIPLRRWLRTVLPEYMIPARFVVLPELPMTANGKIDRRRLTEDPPPGQSLEFESEQRVLPRNVTEENVQAIWMELLDAPEIGVYDDFFALGGQSLLAMQVISRIQDLFSVEIPLSDFLAAPQIAALSELILAIQNEPRRTASKLGKTSRPDTEASRAYYMDQLEQFSEEQLARTLQELE